MSDLLSGGPRLRIAAVRLAARCPATSRWIRPAGLALLGLLWGASMFPTLAVAAMGEAAEVPGGSGPAPENRRGAGELAAAARLTVDFGQARGRIRALHGVNLGPLCYRGMVDLTAYHRALDLPLTRLHDVVWVHYDAVDISTVFRDFRNSPDEAASYDFAATDDYLAAVVAAGSPILYRLGESIEHTPRKYRVHPPKDPARWAAICCQIIRHYNEGWADGFRHRIRYWEIWNEPENQPAMWTGTDAEYFRLYAVTAKAIKAQWPELRVGGPSLGYTGEFKAGGFEPGAFLRQFLEYCREHQAPLDFFSWHRYAMDPADPIRRARAIRAVLDAAGFARTESHLNEWNYLPREDWHPVSREGQGLPRELATAEMGGPKGAAFAAWVLIALQDAPVDMANFYTAEIQMFGLFTMSGLPRKNYHAFRAFRTLLDTPERVQTPACVPGRIAVCAGLNAARDTASILLSHFESTGAVPEVDVAHLPWRGTTRYEVQVLDAQRDLDVVRHGTLDAQGRLRLPELTAPSVGLVRLVPER